MPRNVDKALDMYWYSREGKQVVLPDGSVKYVALMNANGTALVGPDGVIIPTLGSEIVTVGAGGMFSNPTDAITYLGSRFITSPVHSYTVAQTPKNPVTISLTNGSPLFTYVSGQALGGLSGLSATEFILIGTAYYRVRYINGTTGLLWGNFQGATGNVKVTPLILDWRTILLLPGVHSGSVFMQPGFVLSGLGENTALTSESTSGNSPIVMCPMSHVMNMTIGPTKEFGSVDRLDYLDALLNPGVGLMPFGCETRISRSLVDISAGTGPHAGGNARWPVVANGRFVVDSSTIRFGTNNGAVLGGGLAAHTAKLLFKNCDFDWYRTYAGFPSISIFNDLPALDTLYSPIRADFIGCNADLSDLEANPSSGNPITAFRVNTAGNVVNIFGGNYKVTNNHASAAATEFPSVVHCSGGEVNIQGANFEATGSTVSGANQGTAIYNNGGTVNVRAGSRIKGDTNRAINNAAGTVNVSPNADVVGGTTGTITAAAT